MTRRPPMRGTATRRRSTPDVPALRLANHALARASFRRAEDVVRWFGAVQAQDYLGSLWGIGQRTRAATEETVEAAEARRAIVRTWPMRGTLHFVAAADARWMTRLLAPRVLARHAARWKREFGVDEALVARADEVLSGALAGGRRLTREQAYATLEARRIRTGGSRGLHLLLCLAMRGRLCLAGRIGKQHSFALLDEWLPATPPVEREAALAMLATRYFTSHGPASLPDFIWWSGLTAADARAALDAARGGLESATVDGTTYWCGPAAPRRPRPVAASVHLLPAYDEYTVGYAERASLLEPGSRLDARGMGLLSPVVLVNGRIVGTWQRTLDRTGARIATRLARPLSAGENAALREAVAAYGRFIARDARWAGARPAVRDSRR